MPEKGEQFSTVTAEEAHRTIAALHGKEYTGERLEPAVGNPTYTTDPRPEPSPETKLTEPKVNSKATRKKVERVPGGKTRATKEELGVNQQLFGRPPHSGALVSSMVHDTEGNQLKRMDAAEGANNSLVQQYHAGYSSDMEHVTDKAQKMIDFVGTKKRLKNEGALPGEFQTPTVEKPVEGVRYVNREELLDAMSNGTLRYSKQTRNEKTVEGPNEVPQKAGEPVTYSAPSLSRAPYAGISAKTIMSDHRLARLQRIAQGKHDEADLVLAALHPAPKLIPTSDQPRKKKVPETPTNVGAGTSVWEDVQKNGVQDPIEVHHTPEGPRVPNPVDRMKVAAAYAQDPSQSIQFKHVNTEQ